MTSARECASVPGSKEPGHTGTHNTHRASGTLGHTQAHRHTGTDLLNRGSGQDAREASRSVPRVCPEGTRIWPVRQCAESAPAHSRGAAR